MVETIKILADITRKEIEKDLDLDEEMLKNVNAHYSERYGWHLRPTSNVWQDDTK
ncbi:MAG: hypothetical protein H8D84_01230 [Proteobacteria bacterium]|jgi:hypothetical protein|nr:hypothetical protein [Pseudomonadota bacterium]|tara:strand:+ start:1997 stop:2161 length:165 start_codon:yes stop_codon:yes gene_type:complete